MPLPEGGHVPWPPKSVSKIIPYINRWSAWYSGEPEQLVAAYGGSFDPSPARWLDRPSQYAGGIVGATSRMIWGRPKPSGSERDERLHIPLAGDIASTSADLVFSEPPDLTIADDDGSDETRNRLEKYVEDGLFTHVREAAEIQAALGGVYLRAVWDTEIRDHPWLTAIHPDQAVPDWRFDQLVAVTFWEIVETNSGDGTVIRHLERHEPGVILHGLYEGTKAELGNKISLADHSSTESLADEMSPDLGDGIETGIDMLTAVYVPNIRPNRIWRTEPAATNLGRSDFQGVEPIFGALDEAWTSWMRDIRLGKAKILLDQAALTSLGPGKGASFNIDQELLVGLQLGDLGGDRSPIEQVQFNIRVDEHERTTKAITEQAIYRAGYSIQTFSGTTEGSAVTASEVRAREKRSLTTRDRKITYWTYALRYALRMLLALDNANTKGGVDEVPPAVEFPDAVSESPVEVATTIQTLDAAKAVSTEIKIKMLHPDWDDTQIEEEVERIIGPARLAASADALTRVGTASTLLDIDDETKAEMINRAAGRKSDNARQDR